jgi:hypothetical protein
MLKPIDNKLYIMGSYLHEGSMQQSRHNVLEQNHCFMKISAKKCRPLGCIPSKAWITKKIYRTENVNKIHSMVGKNYLQQVGLVSSRQRRKLNLSVSTTIDYLSSLLDHEQRAARKIPLRRGGPGGVIRNEGARQERRAGSRGGCAHGVVARGGGGGCGGAVRGTSARAASAAAARDDLARGRPAMTMPSR